MTNKTIFWANRCKLILFNFMLILVLGIWLFFSLKTSDQLIYLGIFLGVVLTYTILDEILLRTESTRIYDPGVEWKLFSVYENLSLLRIREDTTTIVFFNLSLFPFVKTVKNSDFLIVLCLNEMAIFIKKKSFFRIRRQSESRIYEAILKQNWKTISHRTYSADHVQQKDAY